MKLLGLGCALVLGINSIHVQEIEHKGDYSIVPNWQYVCMQEIGSWYLWRIR